MKETKSIAFLCHPYHRGGVTRWMVDAAVAYALTGYETYFLTLEPAHPFFSGLGRETMLDLLAKKDVGIRIIKTKVGREFEFGTPAYCTFIYKKLLSLLSVGTPVILSDDRFVWDAAAALYNSFPLIGVLHADEDHYYNLGAKYFDKVAMLTCVSKRVSRKIIEKLNAPDLSKIHTIPCGIELPAINTVTQANDLLQLVYVGRISNYQKRVGDLVKIAALLSKKNVPFHLNIIGDGAEEKIELEKKFIDEGLTKQVTFQGWRSQKEVAVFLCSSDILLFTSDFEGTPIAMMEALASGCGIAGTRVSGIEDYEDDALAPDCFMVYNVGDINDAVAKIIKLSAIAPPIRKKAARQIATANFSMQGCLQKYADAIAAIPSRTYISPVVHMSPVELIKSRLISFARYIKVSRSTKK